MSTTAAQDPQAHLHRFGLSSFRPGQREVIAAVLAGRDCLCIMPTGGGKSLCYQLPAVARDGVTLVVSPLIALMKDQVDSLQQLGLRATFVNSSLPPSEQRSRLAQMAAGQFDLMYIAPERLRNSDFLEALRGTRVQLLAVDEAHCISEWGHDFRPDYARLGQFRQRLGNPQTIALTATATPTVRQDVLQLLNLREPMVFITGFARPNLSFEVQSPGSGRAKDQSLLGFLEETPGAGIVYAATRKRCGELVEMLSAAQKRTVGLYHAGLMPDERRRMQDEFMSGRISMIVATNAFGMGIDKADLRFVVHYNMPGSLEAYYQEAGRAGRDGQPSRCLLLFSPSDYYIQEFFIENNYPSREIVAAVYDYLRQQKEDPIEVTLQELKERLRLPVGAEGIGTCEQWLEKCGALERLNSQQNMAAVRIDSDLPTLVDLLPKEAKVQRKVLRAMEKIVGQRRSERVYFHPRQLAAMTELTHDSIVRALRELMSLPHFDYVPPFRGRAVHMLKRDTPFEHLGIDFDELDRRKAAEYEKLDRVVTFANSRRCRQLEILDYFGDPSKSRCRCCDNCVAQGPTTRAVPARSKTLDPLEALDRQITEFIDSARRGALGPADVTGRMVSDALEEPELRTSGSVGRPATTPGRPATTPITAFIESAQRGSDDPTDSLERQGSDTLEVSKSRTSGSVGRPATAPGVTDGAVLEAVKIALSGVARTRGRAGKLLIAKMLCGSRSAQVKKMKLDRLSTFGLLSELKQDEASALLDALLELRLLEQVETQRYRPIVKLTPLGEQVMRGRAPLEARLPIHDELLVKLRTRESAAPSAKPQAEMPTNGKSVSATTSKEESRRETAPAHVPTTVPANVPPPDGVQPDHYWTWRLLSGGFTASECAQIRRLDADVIVDHALRAAESGLSVDARWLLSTEQLAALQKVIGNSPPDRIRPLLDQLPAGLGYEHVQLYLKCRHDQAQQSRNVVE